MVFLGNFFHEKWMLLCNNLMKKGFILVDLWLFSRVEQCAPIHKLHPEATRVKPLNFIALLLSKWYFLSDQGNHNTLKHWWSWWIWWPHSALVLVLLLMLLQLHYLVAEIIDINNAYHYFINSWIFFVLLLIL